MKAACALAFALATALALPAVAGESRHKITVTFNYDFTHQAPCSAEIEAKKHRKKSKKSCIEDFVVYDISAGLPKRTKLMSIPVPQDARGMVKGIVATTPLLLFETGRHLIAVVAQTASGLESDPNRCTVWVTIPN